jgi:hypothetical protein
MRRQFIGDQDCPGTIHVLQNDGRDRALRVGLALLARARPPRSVVTMLLRVPLRPSGSSSESHFDFRPVLLAWPPR